MYNKKTLILASLIGLVIIFIASYLYANYRTNLINEAYLSIFGPNADSSNLNGTSTQDNADVQKVSYTSEGYGFSFEYPKSQESSFRIVSGTASSSSHAPGSPASEYGNVLEEYHFKNNENSSVIISVILKKDFHALTKVGSFTLKDTCWIDDQTAKEAQINEEQFGDHFAYYVGGSIMSDPAHREYAVVTNGDYVLIVRAAYIESLGDTVIGDTISSIVFKNNLASIRMVCDR